MCTRDSTALTVQKYCIFYLQLQLVIVVTPQSPPPQFSSPSPPSPPVYSSPSLTPPLPSPPPPVPNPPNSPVSNYPFSSPPPPSPSPPTVTSPLPPSPSPPTVTSPLPPSPSPPTVTSSLPPPPSPHPPIPSPPTPQQSIYPFPSPSPPDVPVTSSSPPLPSLINISFLVNGPDYAIISASSTSLYNFSDAACSGILSYSGNSSVLLACYLLSSSPGSVNLVLALQAASQSALSTFTFTILPSIIKNPLLALGTAFTSQYNVTSATASEVFPPPPPLQLVTAFSSSSPPLPLASSFSTVPPPPPPTGQQGNGYSGPVISTLAGSLITAGMQDGNIQVALFSAPACMAVYLSGSGNGTIIVIADAGNNRLRSITLPASTVFTLAGTGQKGFVDGTASTAQLNSPTGLTQDPSTRDLYFSDSASNTIRVYRAYSATVETIAGSSISFAGYADGNALGAALFNYPSSVLFLPGAKLVLVADTGNARIRGILLLPATSGSSSGSTTSSTTASNYQVVTLVGPGASSIAVTPNATQPGILLGAAPNVTLCSPWGMTAKNDGSGVFISDICPGNKGRILFYSFLTGNVSLLAGAGSGVSNTTVSLVSPKGLAYDSYLGLYIADSGDNTVKLLSKDFKSLTVVAGSGSSLTSVGPALTSGLCQPTGLAFNAADGSLLITDCYGVRALDLQGFIPDAPSIFHIDVVTTVSTIISTSVAIAISTSVAASAASSMGGSMGGAMAAVQAGSSTSLGAAAITMITSVQFLSLTSGVSANISATYRSLGCALGWANLQFGILGVGDVCNNGPSSFPSSAMLSPPISESHFYPPAPPSLPNLNFPPHHPLVPFPPPLPPSPPAPPPPPGPPPQTPNQDTIMKSGLQNVILVGMSIPLIFLLHHGALRLWRWKWPDGSKPLPGFLVFPRPELMVLKLTMTTMSKSAGLLLAISSPISQGVGFLCLLYIASFFAITGFVLYACNRIRPLLPDHLKEEQQDILIRTFKRICERVSRLSSSHPKTLVSSAKVFVTEDAEDGVVLSEDEVQRGETAAGRDAVEKQEQLEPARTELYVNQGLRLQPLLDLLQRAAPFLLNDMQSSSKGASASIVATSAHRASQPADIDRTYHKGQDSVTYRSSESAISPRSEIKKGFKLLGTRVAPEPSAQLDSVGLDEKHHQVSTPTSSLASIFVQKLSSQHVTSLHGKEQTGSDKMVTASNSGDSCTAAAQDRCTAAVVQEEVQIPPGDSLAETHPGPVKIVRESLLGRERVDNESPGSLKGPACLAHGVEDHAVFQNLPGSVSSSERSVSSSMIVAGAAEKLQLLRVTSRRSSSSVVESYSQAKEPAIRVSTPTSSRHDDSGRVSTPTSSGHQDSGMSLCNNSLLVISPGSRPPSSTSAVHSDHVRVPNSTAELLLDQDGSVNDNMVRVWNHPMPGPVAESAETVAGQINDHLFASSASSQDHVSHLEETGNPVGIIHQDQETQDTHHSNFGTITESSESSLVDAVSLSGQDSGKKKVQVSFHETGSMPFEQQVKIQPSSDDLPGGKGVKDTDNLDDPEGKVVSQEEVVKNVPMLTEEELRTELVKAQLKDRFGPLFEDNRTETSFATTFYISSLISAVSCGVMVGIQQGGNVSPDSAEAKGLSVGLFLSKALFAAYMTWVIPQPAMSAYVVDIISNWLESLVSLCTLLLLYFSSSVTIQNLMFDIHIGIMAMQVASAWLILSSMINLTRKAVEEKKEEDQKKVEAAVAAGYVVVPPGQLYPRVKRPVKAASSMNVAQLLAKGTEWWKGSAYRRAEADARERIEREQYLRTLEAARMEAARMEAEQAERLRLEEEERRRAEADEAARLVKEAAERAMVEAETSRVEAEAARQARLMAEAAEKAMEEAVIAAEREKLQAEAAEKARIAAEAEERARLAAEAAEEARRESEAAAAKAAKLKAAIHQAISRQQDVISAVSLFRMVGKEREDRRVQEAQAAKAHIQSLLTSVALFKEAAEAAQKAVDHRRGVVNRVTALAFWKAKAEEWSVETSVFAVRAKESDSGEVVDSVKVRNLHFNHDWSNMETKLRYQRLVGSADRLVKAQQRRLLDALADIHTFMTAYQDQLRALFIQLSSVSTPKSTPLSSQTLLGVSMPAWMAFCQLVGLLPIGSDEDGQAASFNMLVHAETQDLQNIFLAAKFADDRQGQDALPVKKHDRVVAKPGMSSGLQDTTTAQKAPSGGTGESRPGTSQGRSDMKPEDKRTRTVVASLIPGASDNRTSKLLHRSEFYECVVRLAFHKFVWGAERHTPSEALSLLMNDVVLPQLPTKAIQDPNSFRSHESMYTKQVEIQIVQHMDMLHAVFRLYKAKRNLSANTSFFPPESWEDLLVDLAPDSPAHAAPTETTIVRTASSIINTSGPTLSVAGGLIVSRHEAKLLFLNSKMLVLDEDHHLKKGHGLTQFEFFEAMIRLAAWLNIPSHLTVQTVTKRVMAHKQLAGSAKTKQQFTELLYSVGDRHPLGEFLRNRMQETALHVADSVTTELLAMKKTTAVSGGQNGADAAPLHAAFETLVTYMEQRMAVVWGGTSMAECMAEMDRAVSKYEAGLTELWS